MALKLATANQNSKSVLVTEDPDNLITGYPVVTGCLHSFFSPDRLGFVKKILQELESNEFLNFRAAFLSQRKKSIQEALELWCECIQSSERPKHLKSLPAEVRLLSTDKAILQWVHQQVARWNMQKWKESETKGWNWKAPFWVHFNWNVDKWVVFLTPETHWLFLNKPIIESRLNFWSGTPICASFFPEPPFQEQAGPWYQVKWSSQGPWQQNTVVETRR